MAGAAKPPSRKSLVLEFLRLHRPPEITRDVLATLRRHVLERLPDVTLSDRYLLDLAEQSGVAVSRELGGLPLDLVNRLHLHDLAAAEASLRDIQQEYSQSGSRQRAEDCRRAVLRSRRRLESLLRRPVLSPAKRAEKEEILAWVRIWLESPDLFPAWLDLRKLVISRQQDQT